MRVANARWKKVFIRNECSHPGVLQKAASTKDDTAEKINMRGCPCLDRFRGMAADLVVGVVSVSRITPGFPFDQYATSNLRQ